MEKEQWVAIMDKKVVDGGVGIAWGETVTLIVDHDGRLWTMMMMEVWKCNACSAMGRWPWYKWRMGKEREREKGVYEGLPMARHGGYDRWKKCARGAIEEGKKIKMGNK